MKKRTKQSFVGILVLFILLVYMGCQQPVGGDSSGGDSDLPYWVISVNFSYGVDDLNAIPISPTVYVNFNIDMTDYMDDAATHFTFYKQSTGTPVTMDYELYPGVTQIAFTPETPLEYNTTYVFDTDVTDEGEGYSFPLEVTTQHEAPAYPDDFGIVGMGTDYITTEWEPQPDATRYRYVSLEYDGTDYTVFHDVTILVDDMTLTGGKFQYTDSGLSERTVYQLQLYAGNDAGVWSSPKVIATQTFFDPDPPVITHETYSYGFEVSVTSPDGVYVLQANDGSGTWVDISETLPATDTEAVTEFVWSSFSEFPVPTDIYVRAAIGAVVSENVHVVPECDVFTSGGASWNTYDVYLDDKGDASTGWAEAWMVGSLSVGEYYSIRTSPYGSEPQMDGTNIKLVGEDGEHVINAASGSSGYIVNDDGGFGSFSMINFQVPSSGVYYINIRPDNMYAGTSNPPLWLPDNGDYGWTTLGVSEPEG